MERIFKHKESGEIAYFKDGLFKRGNIVIDLAELPSSEYWEEVNYKSEKTFPQANIIDTWLDPEIEEAAENYCLSKFGSKTGNKSVVDGIYFGANWQAKRMYSEEEVRTIINDIVEKHCSYFQQELKNTVKSEWFKQFKK